MPGQRAVLTWVLATSVHHSSLPHRCFLLPSPPWHAVSCQAGGAAHDLMVGCRTQAFRMGSICGKGAPGRKGLQQELGEIWLQTALCCHNAVWNTVPSDYVLRNKVLQQADTSPLVFAHPFWAWWTVVSAAVESRVGKLQKWKLGIRGGGWAICGVASVERRAWCPFHPMPPRCTLVLCHSVSFLAVLLSCWNGVLQSISADCTGLGGSWFHGSRIAEDLGSVVTPHVMYGSAAKCITSFHIAFAEKVQFYWTLGLNS